MTQLGKYSTDRDNILHFMATCDWANDSFGDVEAPTGYVWRISNTFDEVSPNNSEFNSLIETSVALYSIEDSDSFRESLVGHFLIQEDSNGFVSVLQFDTEASLMSVYSTLQDEFYAWDEQGED